MEKNVFDMRLCGELRSSPEKTFFSNMTAVLPSLGPRGRHAGAFSGSAEPTRDQAPAPKPRSGKTAA